jgi:hypothetical protein
VDSKGKVLVVPLARGWQKIPADLLVGVSEDAEAIDEARQLAESLGRVDCLFVVGSAEEIPWCDGFFDAIYTSGKSTAEMRRVIREGGMIQECQSGY